MNDKLIIGIKCHYNITYIKLPGYQLPHVMHRRDKILSLASKLTSKLQ